jgi:hypothetical protein
MILIRQNKFRHLLILGVFVGIQLFGYVIYFTHITVGEPESFYKTAVIFSVILSIMACQDVFNKLRSTPSGIQYLMLPATITEKYAAAWLYSSLFTLLVVHATYFLVQFIGIGTGNLLTGMGLGFGFPGWTDVFNTVKTVLYTHSLFFFGSILFRKNPFLKTLGSYMGIVFVLTLLTAWIAKMVLFNPNSVNEGTFTLSSDTLFESSINGVPVKQIIEFIGVNITWFLGAVSVLLWGGAYLLLNKKQI